MNTDDKTRKHVYIPAAAQDTLCKEGGKYRSGEERGGGGREGRKGMEKKERAVEGRIVKGREMWRRGSKRIRVKLGEALKKLQNPCVRIPF